MKIGIIQQNNNESIKDNRNRIAAKISKLKQQGAQLVVLQELHDSLYFCQEENVDNFNIAEPIPGEATAFYSHIAKELSLVLATSMFERRAKGLYHNTAVVFEADGSIAGKYRKMHIPDDPAYYEKFYFTPGDLGFKPINTSLGKLGVLVCWDQWYPEAARLMALNGADILIYPTAIGFESTGLPVVTVNRVGYEADKSNQTNGITFWGNSFVAGPQGELLFRAPADCEIEKVVDVDFARTEAVRRWWPFLRDRRIDSYADIVKRYID